MLGDLEHEAIALVRRLERVENCRQVPVELHVDDGARDLANATNMTLPFSSPTDEFQATDSVTGMFPRVAFEYGQIS